MGKGEWGKGNGVCGVRAPSFRRSPTRSRMTRSANVSSASPPPSPRRSRSLDLLGDGGGEAELTLAERVIRLLVGLLRKLGARTPHTPFPFPHSPFPIKKRSQEASS